MAVAFFRYWRIRLIRPGTSTRACGIRGEVDRIRVFLPKSVLSSDDSDSNRGCLPRRPWEWNWAGGSYVGPFSQMIVLRCRLPGLMRPGGESRSEVRTKEKIILGFAVTALLIPAVGAICLHLTQAALQRTIGEDSAVLARETLDKIERSIGRRLEQAELYARHISVDPLLLESNLQFGRLPDPKAYIEQIDRQWIAATTAQPTALMKELLHNNLARRLQIEMEHRGFYLARHGYPVFGEVFVTNRYGANVAQTRITSDYNQADELWWQDAVAWGTYVGDVAFDESAGMRGVNLAIRINDVTEHLVGVIRFVLNLEDVITILDEIR